MATVLMPTPLRRLTGGQAKVEIEGQDIGTLIQAIDAQYPGVADKLLDDDGNIKRFINVFVNDDEVRPTRYRSCRRWPAGRGSYVTAESRPTGAARQERNL